MQEPRCQGASGTGATCWGLCPSRGASHSPLPERAGSGLSYLPRTPPRGQLVFFISQLVWDFRLLAADGGPEWPFRVLPAGPTQATATDKRLQGDRCLPGHGDRGAAQLLRNAQTPAARNRHRQPWGRASPGAAPPLLPCATLLLAPGAGRWGGRQGLAFVGGRGSGGLWKVGRSGLRRALSSSRGAQAPGSTPCCPARREEAPPTGAQSCGPSVGAAFSGCCRLGALPLGRVMPGWSQSLS